MVSLYGMIIHGLSRINGIVMRLDSMAVFGEVSLQIVRQVNKPARLTSRALKPRRNK